MFQDIIEEKCDSYPILLIDTSGSTQDRMTSGLSILETEGEKAMRMLENKNYDKCRVIFWSSTGNAIDSLINVKELNKYIANGKNYYVGGTEICSAFDTLSNDWLNGSINDIYILTDGEICDSSESVSDRFKKLFSYASDNDKKIRLHIVAVENNSTNYTNDDQNAGNKIYRVLQENKLMKFVKSFVTHNNFYTNEFYTNFSNPDVAEGYVPFRGKCFPVTETLNFLLHVEKLIAAITDSNEMLKLSHELSMSVYHLTKSKPIEIKRKIVGLFTQLFQNVPNYGEIVSSLVKEVENHEMSVSTSFQQYRYNREKLFERAQASLHTNVRDNISAVPQSTYISLPIKSDNKYVVFNASSKIVNNEIRLGPHAYANAGITIGSHTVPCFPKNMVHVEFNNQCIRQWLRAIYSRMYHKVANDDVLLYMVLTNMLLMHLSNASDDVKNVYRNLALIILDRRRYQSGGVKEIEHLRSGNPPLPVTNDPLKMNDILRECCTISKINVKPFTLWYAIILALGDDTLIANQYDFCDTDILDDFPNFKNQRGNEQLLNLVKDKIKDKMVLNIKEHNFGNKSDEFEYYCYLLMEDTTESGGFKVPTHKIGDTIVCDPKYVVSADGMSMIKEKGLNKCPICHQALNIKSFEKIKPKSYYVDTPFTDKLYNDLFNKTLHTKVTKDMLLKAQLDLEKMEKLDFNASSYEIVDIPVVMSTMNQHLLTVSNKKDFIKEVLNAYPFLMELDYANVCIAGGFCRSILLNQSVNDIDFFFHGYDMKNKNVQKEMTQRLVQLVDNIRLAINKYVGNVILMTMYKENNNVFEILCLENNENVKKVSVDYIKENLTKFRVYVKIQIVLTINKSISGIFKNFDIPSCCVAFDGKDLYFNSKSHIAYKYMVNTVDETKYTDLYDVRIKKYYENGFAIAMPDLDIKKVSKDTELILSGCKFYVDDLKDNVIFCNNLSVDSSGITSHGAMYKGMYRSFHAQDDDIDGVLRTVDSTLKNALEYIEFVNAGKHKKPIAEQSDSESDNELSEIPNKDEGLDKKVYYNVLHKCDKFLSNAYENGNIEIAFTEMIDSRIKNFNWYGDLKVQNKIKINKANNTA